MTAFWGSLILAIIGAIVGFSGVITNYDILVLLSLVIMLMAIILFSCDEV